MNLQEAEDLLSRMKGISFHPTKNGIYVKGEKVIYLKEREGGLVYLHNVAGKWKPISIKNEKHLKKRLKDIQPSFSRSTQKKILSLLALRGELTPEEISTKLSLTLSQVGQAKREILRKGRITIENDKLKLKGEYAFEETENDKFIHQTCILLTPKRFCPVKKRYMDSRHYKEMCGCLQNINYEDLSKGVYYTPKCVGWIR